MKENLMTFLDENTRDYADMAKTSGTGPRLHSMKRMRPRDRANSSKAEDFELAV